MTFTTTQPSQVQGLEGYSVNPVFTVGETIDGYTPPEFWMVAALTN